MDSWKSRTDQDGDRIASETACQKPVHCPLAKEEQVSDPKGWKHHTTMYKIPSCTVSEWVSECVGFNIPLDT